MSVPASKSIITERHAHAASVLWLRRELAVVAPHYSLVDLERLEEQLEANLDGLRVAGDAGWQACREELRWGEPGEVFAAAVLALEADDDQRLHVVLQAIGETPELQRAFVSAVGWLSADSVEQRIASLWNSAVPQQRLLALGGRAVHRRDGGAMISEALSSDYPPLRIRAVRAVGELARLDLLPQVILALHDGDPSCRIAAACAVARLTDHPEALEVLTAWMDDASSTLPAGDVSDDVLHLGVRRMTSEQATAWIQRLAANPCTRRAAVIAAGRLGLPDLIPWLLQVMPIDVYARSAGEAFSMITGVDLVNEAMEGEPPEGFSAGPTDDPNDENVALDGDENLPWPRTDDAAQWWMRHGEHFAPGARYLLGQPIDRPWLCEVLRNGLQRQRAAAAWELAVRHPQSTMFNVKAPALRQRRELQVAVPPGQHSLSGRRSPPLPEGE